MHTSRRQFLNRSAVALAGGALLSGTDAINASPMNQPIGFQCFEIIGYLNKDWEGTWKKMAGFGYKFVDLVTFSPRTAPNIAKLTAKEIRQGIQAGGLGVDNCHFSYASLTDSFGETMAAAHDLGLKTMVCSTGPRRKTVDDWKWMGDQLNTIGAKTQREGFPLGYHNHEIEFVAIDGQIPFDILMASTDPKLVKFQIDVGNLTFGGADAIAYLAKYPDRYFSLHAKDFVRGKASVPVGTGTLDWKKIFALAAKAGIKSYVAEVGAYGVATLNGEPLEPSSIDVLESFRLSAIFLNDFKG
jgi:sugar phosphate isomerase/epimerase